MTKMVKPILESSKRGAHGDGIVIVGAGLAGLFTALKLAPMPVTVVSAAPFGKGGSSVWAQAGIAAALAEGDSPEAHAADTIAAGAGIVDEEIALLLAREASTFSARRRMAPAASCTSRATPPAAPSWPR